jgi:hypothetical protein
MVFRILQQELSDAPWKQSKEKMLLSPPAPRHQSFFKSDDYHHKTTLLAKSIFHLRLCAFQKF